MLIVPCGLYNFLNISSLSQEKKYEKIIEFCEKKGIKPLSLEEKVRLFNSPEFFAQAQYHYMRGTKMAHGGFASGSRRLTQQEGGYYHSNEEFLEEVRNIRHRTGKSLLRVLDVGGNFGFALKDMKDLVPDIETFNMTIDEHPSLFGDHVVRCMMEMMPATFEETMDLIDSQVAFRYFLYSDIALRNVIQSLVVGGVARISYEVGDPINLSHDNMVRLDEPEIRNRQKKLWMDLKILVDQSYLDITGSSSSIQHLILNPSDHLIGGFIKIVKNKSTRNISF